MEVNVTEQRGKLEMLEVSFRRMFFGREEDAKAAWESLCLLGGGSSCLVKDLTGERGNWGGRVGRRSFELEEYLLRNDDLR